MSTSTARITGLLLAGGAGRRFGGPKALAQTDGMPWVARSARVLLDGGCGDVLVVTGAQSADVEQRVSESLGPDPRIATTFCGTWEQGMGESLRAGLMALVARGRTVPLVAVVHLVDLPDVGPEVVARLLERSGARPSGLTRAAYQGVAGHPVVLGQEHWQGVLGDACGDQGARRYLRRTRPMLVECGDLATGRDVDVTHSHSDPPGSAPSGDRAHQLDALRSEAEDELREVEHELTALRTLRSGLHDDDEHDPDGVSLSSEWSRLEGRHRDAQERVGRVREAQVRVATGGGDDCTVCGAAIAPDRLAARPEAITCIDCAR